MGYPALRANILGFPLAWCRARVKWGAHTKFQGDGLCGSGGRPPDIHTHFHLYIVDELFCVLCSKEKCLWLRSGNDFLGFLVTLCILRIIPTYTTKWCKSTNQKELKKLFCEEQLTLQMSNLTFENEKKIQLGGLKLKPTAITSFRSSNAQIITLILENNNNQMKVCNIVF